MAKSSAVVDLKELQQVIDNLESIQEFKSPNKLYQAVADSEWGKNLGITPVVVYLRCADKANNIRFKTQRTKGVKAPKGEAASPEKVSKSKDAFRAFDVNAFLEAFVDRGVEVTGIASVLASADKSDEQNQAIILAWADLRDRTGAFPLNPKTSRHAKIMSNVWTELQNRVPGEAVEFETNEGVSSRPVYLEEASTASVEEGVVDADRLLEEEQELEEEVWVDGEGQQATDLDKAYADASEQSDLSDDFSDVIG